MKVLKQAGSVVLAMLLALVLCVPVFAEETPPEPQTQTETEQATPETTEPVDETAGDADGQPAPAERGGRGVQPAAGIVAGAPQAGDRATLEGLIATAPTDFSEYQIDLTTDMQLDGTLDIASGKNIVLGTTTGAEVVLSVGGNYRHFEVKDGGSLTIADDLALEGQSPANGGGISGEASSTIVLDGGIIRSCAGSSNGGAIGSQGYVVIQSGSITGNSASYGGGVSVVNSTANGGFSMTGGRIAGNTVSMNGGGVYLSGDMEVTLSGASIEGNQCTLSGTNTRQGGGLAFDGAQAGSSRLVLEGDTDIVGNYAQRGGGVYTQYVNVEVNQALVDGNTVSRATSSANGGASIFPPTPIPTP